MWWDDLETLSALARRGTMGGAAQELAVDKATVSRRVASLERAAPRALFERRLGRIEITPYGHRALEAYAEYARARLRLAGELERDEGEPRGLVRVTVPSFFACEVLVPALGAFRASQKEVDLFVYGSNRVLDLTRAEADVALRNVRPRAPGLTARKVGRLRLSTFASRDYLKRRGAPHAQSLEGHDLLVYDSGPYAGPGFEWWPDAARRARVVFSANDSLPLREAARAGLGLAVIPTFLGEEAPELVRVPAVGDGTSELWLVTREELRQVPRVRAVLGFMAEVIRSNQARLAAGA
jgi:DNA-binding transcriptional LysR family regulator